VRYHRSQNANRYVSSNQGHHGKKQHQIDKQRVLNVEHLKNQHQSQQLKQRLAATKQGHKEPRSKARQGLNRQENTATLSGKRDKRNDNNHKQRLINGANGERRSRVVKKTQGERKMQHQSSSLKGPQPSTSNKPQRYVQKKASHNDRKAVYRSRESNNQNNKYRAKSHERQLKNQRHSSSTHNKSRPVKTANSRQKESRH
jgi:hypothetical protein